MFEFNRTLPEDVGIPSKAIRSVLEYLDKKEIPMHSLLIMRGDKLVFEKYYAPYKRDTLHRLFSISKTLTALAISLLIDESRVSFDSSITDYFPEYVTDSTHHWIKETTIRNMLEMRTCHASTTYKVDMKSDWVESFFVVKPTHKPGTVFHYDTSAAHVLCALAEKLTGMSLLDYLKEKVFKYMDFSQDSYMVKDPFGVSMGGSGLMATPLDFLKILYLIEKRGTIICNDGVTRTLLSKEFLDRATSNISDTVMTAPIPGEAQGYGMQIWQNEKGGYLLYGMGGQLGISIPDKNLLIITTSDTQGIQGGNQVIYDSIYRFLLPAIDNENGYSDKKAYKELLDYADTLAIAPPRMPEGRIEEYRPSLKSFSDYFGGNSDEKNLEYSLQPNPQGFEKLLLHIAETGASSIAFTKGSKEIKLFFGLGRMEGGNFPIYDTAYTAGGIFLRDNVLYIRFHLIGECVGSVRMELYFGEGDITVFMRKVEETYFKEFDGHLYGTMI